MGEIRAVLADDHVVLRVGLRSFLEEQVETRVRVVGEASSGQEALTLLDEHDPDLLIVDLSMSGMGGLETTIEVRRRKLRTRVLVLTQHQEPLFLKRLLEAGADGYILKSARGEELLSAVRAVTRGGVYIDPTLAGTVLPGNQTSSTITPDEEILERLTTRERQVLKLVADGYSNKEIAQSLGVAVKTVMAHRYNLMEKLDIHNRAKLVQFAIRVGLVTPG